MRLLTALLLIFATFISSINLGGLLNVAFASENTVAELSSDKRGDILDNFKARQKEIIENNGMSVDEEDLQVIGNLEKLGVFADAHKKAEERRKALEERYKHLNKKRITLAEMISELDSNIDEKRLEISKTNAEIIVYISEIEKNREEIIALQDKIEKNRAALSEYLVHIYKERSNIYNNDDIDSIKAIVLGGGNLGDVLMNHNFNIIVEMTGEKLIEKHRSYVKDLYVLKADLSKKINNSRKTKRGLEVMKKILEDKIGLKEQILLETEGSEYIYKKYLKKKVRDEKLAKVEYIKERTAYDKIKKSIDEKYGCLSSENIDKEICANLEKMVVAESKLTKNSDDLKFDWPFNPEFGISAHFNDDEYYKEFDSTHDAIDLVAEQGTPIKAPEDGYVIYVNPPRLGGYSYIVLKHSDDYVTVYGHLSEVKVQKFDFIEKGEVFAFTGGEIGTAGAGIMTTGPHLHFEIIHEGEARDPLNYFDLTEIKLEDLPVDRYMYKYYEDYKKKYGEDKAIEDKLAFNLDGDTEIERQKNAVWKYGVNGFGNWNLWVEEGMEAKIDPSFLICIGIAETGLGRRLKTKNNVGNIGNTDSGSTYQFDTPRAGIYWMGKTLNNPYLGGYNEIRMLSRYGNKDKAIYASDPQHWHNNVVKCMSEMKGYYIKDDYNFRLSESDISMLETVLENK